MEVNIKNAFMIVVKISWRYCDFSQGNVTLTMLKTFKMLIYLLLENPILTTLLLLFFSLLLLLTLSVSFLILAGVTCLLTIIIICEGLTCLTFLLVIGLVMYSIMLTMANIHGVYMWLNKLIKLDTSKPTEE